MGSEGEDGWAEVVGFEKGKRKEKKRKKREKRRGERKKEWRRKRIFFGGGPKLWRNTGLQAGKRVEMSVSS